jgi:hypothetical protein
MNYPNYPRSTNTNVLVLILLPLFSLYLDFTELLDFSIHAIIPTHIQA